MNSEFIATSQDRILITGSNGFIGTRVVATLLNYGFTNLRCFVRPSSQLQQLNKVLEDSAVGNSVQMITGTLLSREDCEKAVEGVSMIYHLAAGIEKSFAGAFMNSALATRNLIDASLKHGRLKRFVNVSSFAVYSNLKMKRHALLDECSPLEDCFQKRFDAYGFGKRKQEELVVKYGESPGLPYVILRPGAVFGPGKDEITGRVGIDTFGVFLHLGGSNQIPFTYVENCAEAIVLAGLKAGVEGEIFNVVDDELPTSREFLRFYKRNVRSFFSLPVPYLVTSGLCRLWEQYSEWTKGQLPPVFNRRRCAAEWKGNRYSNEKLKKRLGWQPRVGMRQALESLKNSSLG